MATSMTGVAATTAQVTPLDDRAVVTAATAPRSCPGAQIRTSRVPSARARISAPSSTRCGACRSSAASLPLAGSPSAALTTTTGRRRLAATARTLRATGKPAPPRPRSDADSASRTTAATSSSGGGPTGTPAAAAKQPSGGDPDDAKPRGAHGPATSRPPTGAWRRADRADSTRKVTAMPTAPTQPAASQRTHGVPTSVPVRRP